MDYDERGHPKVADRYIRVYEDHTGRWYRDYTIAEYKSQLEAMDSDPLTVALRTAIQDEIDRELLSILCNVVIEE